APRGGRGGVAALVLPTHEPDEVHHRRHVLEPHEVDDVAHCFELAIVLVDGPHDDTTRPDAVALEGPATGPQRYLFAVTPEVPEVLHDRRPGRVGLREHHECRLRLGTEVVPDVETRRRDSSSPG